MFRRAEELIKRSLAPGVPLWLVPVAVTSGLFILLQSVKHRRENFSVFLFDYEYGFTRRGFLGSIVDLLPATVEPYAVFIGFYSTVGVLSYFLVLLLIYRSLVWKEQRGILANFLLGAVIVFSPVFLKNLYWDFGRVDQLGTLCLILFALAPWGLQAVLVVALPLLLLLCHEGQIILTIAPMVAIFVIGSLRDGRAFALPALVPLAIAVTASLALTFCLIAYGTPDVAPEVLSQYFESKSPYNTKERSWLLYDDVTTNLEIGMGTGREAVQLAASPVYLLVVLLNLPVITLLFRAFKGSSDRALRLACAAIVVTVTAQGVIFFLSIDYSRHVANIFCSFVVMLFFLIYRFQLGDLVIAHVTRYRGVFIALLLVSLSIRKFGIVTP